MKSSSLLTLVAMAAFAVTGSAIAGPKSYQVTGPVLAVTDSAITVQKGDDKWEVARDGTTKITGDLKVGAKVTISYTMTAVSVDAKDGAAAAKPAGDAKKSKKDKK